MAVDKLSDEDLERLRKAADVAAMKARAAVEGSLSKAVEQGVALKKGEGGLLRGEAEVKEAVKTRAASLLAPTQMWSLRVVDAHPCYLASTTTPSCGLCRGRSCGPPRRCRRRRWGEGGLLRLTGRGRGEGGGANPSTRCGWNVATREGVRNLCSTLLRWQRARREAG